MNIAKLNTVSLDDKTFIIKRGTSGGANINNQNKVVDITENGTVDIVPDAGYTGLAKVTANVNVSGGSGGELEGEYVLLKRNGWYWKLTDTFINADKEFHYQTVTGLFIMMGTIYEALHVLTTTSSEVLRSELRICYRDIGALQEAYISNLDGETNVSRWRAIAEGGSTKIDFGGILGEYNSIYEAICALASPMTEAEFEAMMLSEYKLQRITKEEYESLITA